ncbi:hypothetical protein JY97_08985 [Alkalispirochaeta odontotermitis]|nr:hypothetical protein JY97_08985 [Alkalispirochaeta odontotermitis]
MLMDQVAINRAGHPTRISNSADVSNVSKNAPTMHFRIGFLINSSKLLHIRVALLAWVVCLMVPPATQAFEKQAEIKISAALNPGLLHFLQKKHIYRGLKRFAAPFKAILEFGQLPSTEIMADDFSRVRGLSEDALRSKMVLYSDMLPKRYGPGQPRSKKWPPDLLKDNHPWIDMTPQEMESILVIEYMKYALGKTRADEVRELLGVEAVDRCCCLKGGLLKIGERCQVLGVGCQPHCWSVRWPA